MTETRHPPTLLPLIARIERLSASCIEQQLAHRDLTYAQFRLLGHLKDEGEGLSQKALAARMRLDPSSISVALGPLERRGLVERRRDARDRRNVLVRLTVGQSEIERVLEDVARIESAAISGLDDGARAQLQDSLQAIAERLADMAAPGVGSPHVPDQGAPKPARPAPTSATSSSSSANASRREGRVK